jgi:probable rRNA maturation factor
MSKIAIHCPDDFAIDRGTLRDAVRAVLEGEDVAEAEISIALVDDATIHQLNRRYLDHDEPTDVLSFPLGQNPLAGELVIGYQVAERTAQEYGHAVAAEVILYIIHGLLHLVGYDDKKPGRAKQMRERERHYLARLGLPNIAPE